MKERLRSYIPNNAILQLLFLLLILFVFLLLMKSLLVFLPGLLGAICLFVLLLPVYRWLHIKRSWHKMPTIIVLMVGSAIMIIIPLLVLIQTLSKKILVVLNDKERIKQAVSQFLATVQERYEFNLLNEGNLSKIVGTGGKILESILNASVNGLIQIGIAYLLLYFMLSDYKRIKTWFYNIMPLKRSNMDNMKKDLERLVLSNAIGVPVTAFLQAIIAYVGYLIFGVEDAFVFFILTVFAAMLPVVGAALIYIPLGLILLGQGDTFNAVGLLAYCFIIVGLSDNLIRFVLQKKMADVHPLITIFGVIVGIDLFGFIGIIFGPILFSLFFWLVKIYKNEFVNSNEESPGL